MTEISASTAPKRKEKGPASAGEAGPQRRDARAASTVGAGGNSRRRGIGGHHSASAVSVEWLTPPEILEALGPFDLDPCAPLVRPWPMAARHFTVEDNGLIQRWEGRTFVNPPYTTALVTKFMARLAEHSNGTALVFARTETEWWFAHVWPVATAVLFMGPHRIHFHYPDGRRAENNAGAPTALIAYGTYDADRLADSGIEGAFVPLPGSRQIIAVFRPDASVTWVELLERVARRQGGRLKVSLAYVLVKHHPKAAANPNFQAKIRQILQGPSFRRVAPATYELRASA